MHWIPKFLRFGRTLDCSDNWPALAKLGWLVTLKNSARNWSDTRSPIFVVLDCGHIRIEIAWAAQRVLSRVSESSNAIRPEIVRIKPLSSHARMRTMARQSVFYVRGVNQVSPIRSDPAEGIINAAHDRERIAARPPTGNSGHFPSVQNRIGGPIDMDFRRLIVSVNFEIPCSDRHPMDRSQNNDRKCNCS